MHFLSEDLFYLKYSVDPDERRTCIKGQIWPPLEPKTESCFSSFSPYLFIIKMVQV